MNNMTEQDNGGIPGGDYEAVQANNGTWTVKALPIFSEVKQGARGNDQHIGSEWMQAAIAKCTELKLVQQHMAPVHLGHHGALKNKNTPRVGFLKLSHIGKMPIEGTPSWVLFADVVGISEKDMKELKALSHPYRSVEIGDWNKPEIASLALLSDESPYFKFPMMTIGEMKASKKASMKFEGTIGTQHFFEFAFLPRSMGNIPGSYRKEAIKRQTAEVEKAQSKFKPKPEKKLGRPKLKLIKKSGIASESHGVPHNDHKQRTMYTKGWKDGGDSDQMNGTKLTLNASPKTLKEHTEEAYIGHYEGASRHLKNRRANPQWARDSAANEIHEPRLKAIYVRHKSHHKDSTPQRVTWNREDDHHETVMNHMEDKGYTIVSRSGRKLSTTGDDRWESGRHFIYSHKSQKNKYTGKVGTFGLDAAKRSKNGRGFWKGVEHGTDHKNAGTSEGKHRTSATPSPNRLQAMNARWRAAQGKGAKAAGKRMGKKIRSALGRKALKKKFPAKDPVWDRSSSSSHGRGPAWGTAKSGGHTPATEGYQEFHEFGSTRKKGKWYKDPFIPTGAGSLGFSESAPIWFREFTGTPHWFAEFTDWEEIDKIAKKVPFPARTSKQIQEDFLGGAITAEEARDQHREAGKRAARKVLRANPTPSQRVDRADRKRAVRNKNRRRKSHGVSDIHQVPPPPEAMGKKRKKGHHQTGQGMIPGFHEFSRLMNDYGLPSSNRKQPDAYRIADQRRVRDVKGMIKSNKTSNKTPAGRIDFWEFARKTVTPKWYGSGPYDEEQPEYRSGKPVKKLPRQGPIALPGAKKESNRQYPYREFPEGKLGPFGGGSRHGIGGHISKIIDTRYEKKRPSKYPGERGHTGPYEAARSGNMYHRVQEDRERGRTPHPSVLFDPGPVPDPRKDAVPESQRKRIKGPGIIETKKRGGVYSKLQEFADKSGFYNGSYKSHDPNPFYHGNGKNKGTRDWKFAGTSYGPDDDTKILRPGQRQGTPESRSPVPSGRFAPRGLHAERHGTSDEIAKAERKASQAKNQSSKIANLIYEHFPHTTSVPNLHKEHPHELARIYKHLSNVKKTKEDLKSKQEREARLKSLSGYYSKAATRKRARADRKEQRGMRRKYGIKGFLGTLLSRLRGTAHEGPQAKKARKKYKLHEFADWNLQKNGAQARRVLSRNNYGKLVLNPSGAVQQVDVIKRKMTPLKMRQDRGQAPKMSQFKSKAKWTVQPPGIGWYSEFSKED